VQVESGDRTEEASTGPTYLVSAADPVPEIGNAELLLSQNEKIRWPFIDSSGC
jgi:hypothetical protein